MNRRQFLTRSSAASLAAALSSPAALALAPLAPVPSVTRPKNLIFLVSDGMSAGCLSLVERWCQRNYARSSHWYQLLQSTAPSVVRSLQDVASANALVPDSAAAGSAWGCGKRIDNSAINFHADAPAGEPLYLRAKHKGYATGLVTTARVTHATPASFVANVSHRREEEAIARQYLERGVDCILGGGHNRFSNEDGSDNAVLSAYRAANFCVIHSALELAQHAAAEPNDQRLLGLFSQDHLPYAIDRSKQRQTTDGAIPALTTMMSAALKKLSRNDKGFLLQVEAARVDHAAHANDPAGLLHEQLEFDQCIPLALDFVASNPDTLVVITTDHGCGGCQLNGVWPNYADSDPAFDSLRGMDASFEFLFNAIRAGQSPGTLVKKHLGLTLDPANDAAIYATCTQEGAWYGMLSDVLQAHLYAQTAIGWTSQHHTAEAVDLIALGKGAERFPAFLLNTAVFDLVAELFEI